MNRKSYFEMKGVRGIDFKEHLNITLLNSLFCAICHFATLNNVTPTEMARRILTQYVEERL